MGTRNRERRKAKEKVRAQRQRVQEARWQGRPFDLGNTDGRVDPRPSVGQRPEDLVDALIHSTYARESPAYNAATRLVVGRQRDEKWHRAVDLAVLAAGGDELASAWERGWQPADIVRLVSREHGTGHAVLATDLIAAQLREYASATVDERWSTQLVSMGATAWWGGDDGFLEQCAQRDGVDRATVFMRMIDVVRTVCQLPELPVLCPPPGKARRGSIAPSRLAGRSIDKAMLDRVRALLAKAESTEFPEEAEALAAKAQELMARHSIDYALLAARTVASDEPVGIRVGVDNPYERPKALLLENVAAANRCRAVWSPNLGFVTVLGFAADLEAVEMLYTSLLVQATSAMAREGSFRDESGRSRTRSFRQSFLAAYAIRIGQRLAQATAAATDEAASNEGGAGSGLLPVLASREGRVRDTVESMFPGIIAQEVSLNNREGWVSGIAAADLAALHARRAVSDQAR